MAAMHEDELLTVAETARLLKVSTVTIHRWLKQGRLPSYRVGPRAVRVRRADLNAVVHRADADEAQSPGPGYRIVTSIEDIRPLTEEEKQRVLAALERSKARGERILARRGGVPLDESWPMIREAREERSRQI